MAFIAEGGLLRDPDAALVAMRAKSIRAHPGGRRGPAHSPCRGESFPGATESGDTETSLQAGEHIKAAPLKRGGYWKKKGAGGVTKIAGSPSPATGRWKAAAKKAEPKKP